MSEEKNKNNNSDMVTPPEEQKKRESEAVAKEHEALRKSSAKFSELTHNIELGGGDDELKQTVRLLVMAEQTDALTAVLTRLNGDRQAWEMAQREPVALVAMIIEEQQKRMQDLQKKLQAAATAAAAAGQQ